MWTLTMTRMRGAHNVYSAYHDDSPTLISYRGAPNKTQVTPGGDTCREKDGKMNQKSSLIDHSDFSPSPLPTDPGSSRRELTKSSQRGTCHEYRMAFQSIGF